MFAVEESGEADLAALLRVAEDDPPVLTSPRDLRYWHLSPNFKTLKDPRHQLHRIDSLLEINSVVEWIMALALAPEQHRTKFF
jgi:hypothetical protein